MEDWHRERRVLGPPGQPHFPGSPGRDSLVDWKTWGQKRSIDVPVTGPGELTLELGQLLNAEFHHPVGWLVGISAETNLDPTGPLDTLQFLADMTYGLGEAFFRQRLIGATMSGVVGVAPVVNVFGPFPAQTLFASLRIHVTPAVNPRTYQATMGIFVCPQVWQ